ncbi:MAG: hypothetical protein D6693_02680 [Planctomycetota bacterium]|nr:MAG: hypothetical protein D6693_02680 [Planctomycetota bacterium]
MTPRPHALLFEPILKDKVWGGDRLGRLGKRVAPGARVGESWELADLDRTSPTGGGGDAARSVVRAGPLAGATIRDAMRAWGADLLGEARPTDAGGFPLLIKFLDARTDLSVQVHPSPAHADRRPGAHLKHEAWRVVAAEPGAVIYRGLRPGVTHEDLARGAGDGSIVGMLLAEPARTGMTYHLPSGVVHALGAGVLVAEVQTPSDTTYRLYDWGRRGRALHVEEALACVFDDAGAQTVPASALPDARAQEPTRTDAFIIEPVALAPGASAPMPRPGSPTVMMLLRGSGRIEGAGPALAVSAGNTALIPAACARSALIAEAPVEALVVSIPAPA